MPAVERLGIGEIVLNMLFSKPGLVVMLGCAAYIGYTNRELIMRTEQGVLRRSVPVEQGYFPDPAGLQVDVPINGNGRQEVYLVHAPSERRIPIRDDLLPDSQVMLDGLARRADAATPDEAIRQLDALTQYQHKLVQKLKPKEVT
jgi:hypothetical protein